MIKPLTIKKIVMVGFGSIGQASLPLLIKHFKLSSDQITVISPGSADHPVARHFNISPISEGITRENCKQVLSEYLSAGDVLLNLSVDVSSEALVELCQELGAFYLDTCIEPWAGHYSDEKLSVSERSNYALRESALKLRALYPKGPTAILGHGANPGLVSHFVKQALLNIATDLNHPFERPKTKQGWAKLANQLGLKAIHIAEHDTQRGTFLRKPHQFLNTWSVDGFLSEGQQPAELGWGTHERHFPKDAQTHTFGSQAAIYINQSGLETRVRSWTPLSGPIQGILITHNEAISLSDYFTVKEGDKVTYRPTAHYSYHPCEAALLSIHEYLGNNMKQPESQKIMLDEISEGMDELGVLLMGHEKGAYWFGSQLTIDEARNIAPYNNATSMQVVAGILGGITYMLSYPNHGIMEPEEIDEELVLQVAKPYLGELVGAYTDWTPIKNRLHLFPEALDHEDPWQFINFRLT